ncbi:MAG: UDP-N-acetylmuramate--L-alanine ligase [Deltaproteobacteria bacterium]|nr:UDP-N-acetylmuramate--L-alanine ligase [Deltaproteobacteria bacterium]
MARRTRLVHFVGIGGIGMSGIAEVLLNLGYQVRGSDLKEGEVAKRLRSLGADVRIGHSRENVENADVVVISSAVRADNPEVRAAREAKVPVIRRAEMLAELMRLKYGIAIGGTHGKTTTTSMVATLLTHAGLDPTVVVGGKINKLGSNAKLGQGPYLVAEADESDGSFLHLGPTIAVITNIDLEHLDYYSGGLEQIRQAFVDFANRVPFYGLAVLCIDHPVVQAILPQIERRFVTYGLNPQADYQARHLSFDGPRTSFELVVRGVPRGRYELRMLGEHNVKNALAALAVADELGVEAELARQGLESFDGVDRRFSVRGEEAGVMVVDDYGHHPEEIRVTLEGARRAYPERRILVGFQPHRFTRTRDLLEDFATAFHQAERLFLCPIYAAGEDPIGGISSEALAERMRARGHRGVVLAQDIEQVASLLAVEARSGDLILTFGAGDITRAGPLVLEHLRRRAGGGP